MSDPPLSFFSEEQDRAESQNKEVIDLLQSDSDAQDSFCTGGNEEADSAQQESPDLFQSSSSQQSVGSEDQGRTDCVNEGIQDFSNQCTKDSQETVPDSPEIISVRESSSANLLVEDLQACSHENKVISSVSSQGSSTTELKYPYINVNELDIPCSSHEDHVAESDKVPAFKNLQYSQQIEIEETCIPRTGIKRKHQLTHDNDASFNTCKKTKLTENQDDGDKYDAFDEDYDNSLGITQYGHSKKKSYPKYYKRVENDHSDSLGITQYEPDCPVTSRFNLVADKVDESYDSLGITQYHGPFRKVKQNLAKHQHGTIGFSQEEVSPTEGNVINTDGDDLSGKDRSPQYKRDSRKHVGDRYVEEDSLGISQYEQTSKDKNRRCRTERSGRGCSVRNKSSSEGSRSSLGLSVKKKVKLSPVRVDTDSLGLTQIE